MNQQKREKKHLKHGLLMYFSDNSENCANYIKFAKHVLRFLHRVRSIATRMWIIQGNACVVLNIVLYHISTFVSAWIIQNSKVQETHVWITTFYCFQSSYSIPVTAYLDDDTSNFMYLKNVKTDKVSRVTQYSVWLRAGRPGDRGSILGRGERIFPVSRPSLRPTQPPIEWVPGSPFPGDKARPGRDADHSLPSSVEVENE
jgi:hypothetical protein